MNKGFVLATVFIAMGCSKAPYADSPPAAPPAERAEESGALLATDLAGAAESAPATGPDTTLFAQPAPADDPLTDRLWLLTPDGGRLGAMMIFLSDGVMMQGSCAETYRLSKWRRDETGKVTWSEDTAEISAEVIALDKNALTLGINLRDEQKVERFKPAAAPFVCPDLPR